MSFEIIAIIIGAALVVLLVLGALYEMHTAKGKAEGASLLTSVTSHVSTEIANVKASIATAVGDLKTHVTTTAATVTPAAPAVVLTAPNPAINSAPPAPIVVNSPAPQAAPPVTAPPVAAVPAATSPFFAYASNAQAVFDARTAENLAHPDPNAGIPNTDATFAPPINGQPYQRDIANGTSTTSPKFPMKAGKYAVTLLEGLTRSQGNAVLDGVGPLPGSSIVVPTDMDAATVTMSAIPGNLDPTSGGMTRLSVMFHGPLAAGL